MLDNIVISKRQIVFGSDLNLIFDCKLETILKKKTLAKLIETNEDLNLCDIWSIRTPTPLKKMLHFSSESGFWFHSKKAKLYFDFRHT